jgi:hypothetical protein
LQYSSIDALKLWNLEAFPWFILISVR